MYQNTVKEIQDALKDTCLNVDNALAIFEIKSLLHDLRQGESSVTQAMFGLMEHNGADGT